MSVALGIDVGTQSVKVVAYDAESRICIDTASSPLALHQTIDGVAEQNAKWWIDALKVALASLNQSSREAIAAIGVSGQQHGFVPVDKNGLVLAPVKLWCDTSTGAECDEIMSSYGGIEASIAEVGNPILPGYTASKIRWFRREHPELYARMDCVLLPHDYVNYYLTGERCMETGDASGTGFLDVRRREWSRAMLHAIDPERDLGDCLPDVVKTNQAIGTILPRVAGELGLPVGIPVSIGGGDNMMAAIGTGNVTADIVTMSLGTSGTVYAHSDSPVVDASGNIAGFCSSTGGWLPLVCTMNCTVATELTRDLLNIELAAFESQILGSEIGAHGLMTVPFFNGERTPNLPSAKACVFGMDSNNMRPENFLRSAVEGTTFSLRFGLSELTRLGIRATEIVLTGGGAKSPCWRQMIADVCNTPVTVLKTEEGAALGAALQALEMLGGVDIASLTADHLEKDVERCCQPDAGSAEAYEEIYGKYQHAVTRVADYYEDKA